MVRRQGLILGALLGSIFLVGSVALSFAQVPLPTPTPAPATPATKTLVTAKPAGSKPLKKDKDKKKTVSKTTVKSGTPVAVEPAKPPGPVLGDDPIAATMLLRTVPLVVTGYPQAATLEAQTKTPDTVVALLNTNPPLLVHMEAIREAYTNFGKTDLTSRAAFLKALRDRYTQDPNNANNFFDYGYAQLVMEADKNGLFFLRKANDQLASPVTSLAYALAQTDADWLMEKAPPADLTTRKMDVAYKLKDALMLNRQAQLAGVWPTFLNILAGLKSFQAFDSIEQEDMTTLYVPYSPTPETESSGDTTANQLMAVTSDPPDAGAPPSGSETVPVSAIVPDISKTCKFDTPLSANYLKMSQTVDLNHTGKSDSINFYRNATSGPYTVQVVDEHNTVIGEFYSYAAPYIAEDLNGDHHFELVVRQAAQDPLHPLKVYRWNGQCFGEDQAVSKLFQ